VLRFDAFNETMQEGEQSKKRLEELEKQEKEKDEMFRKWTSEMNEKIQYALTVAKQTQDELDEAIRQ